ncbi:MAG: TIGR02300 family protein [Alphaproteobacteria bacterium]|nr:MAG: TIGR02300 family protein [Alphaproteobacteria bacterium]|tara:strand:+ start:83 stop:505 length:423 start_codon:yes stop_codon:yes gene_type:complete
MSKPEWGIKRVCPSCSIKYYDFNKSPIICPKCEFEFDPDLLLKSRKGRSIATKTEVNEVSSDVQKEDETLENDITSIENDEDILEIEDETDIQDSGIDNNIDKKINTNDDIEIIEDGLEDKDDFSIEIDDQDNNSIEDQK